MRRLVHRRHGDPTEVMELIEEPDPTPSARQIRVRLKAMTINPADLLTIEGRYGAEPCALPNTPGLGAFGLVDAVGADVSRFQIGDEVLPIGGGLWADAVVVDERMAVRAPDGVDPFQAAMMRANPSTAEVLLTDYGSLQPGDWLVQNAANSSVGRLVVRFARLKGIKTLNIVRRETAVETLERDGADVVIVDDGAQPAGVLAEKIAAVTGGARPKLALDAIAGDATAELARSLGEGGIVVVYGLLSGAPAQVDPRELVFRDVSMTGFWLSHWYQSAGSDRIRALNALLAERLEQGLLETDVAASYPLDAFREAIAHAASGGRSGKIMFTGE